MGYLENAINHVEALKGRIEEFAIEGINEHKEYILNLLRDGQLAKGESPEGEPLGWIGSDERFWGSGFYTERTEKRAAKEGTRKPKKEGQPYNFQWSGETFDQMDLSISGTDFQMFSKTWYFNTLLQEYGEVFYLSDFHAKIINEEVILGYIEEKIWSEITNF